MRSERSEQGGGGGRGTTHAREEDPFHRLSLFEGAGDVRDLPRAAVGLCGVSASVQYETGGGHLAGKSSGR